MVQRETTSTPSALARASLGSTHVQPLPPTIFSEQAPPLQKPGSVYHLGMKQKVWQHQHKDQYTSPAIWFEKDNQDKTKLSPETVDGPQKKTRNGEPFPIYIAAPANLGVGPMLLYNNEGDDAPIGLLRKVGMSFEICGFGPYLENQPVAGKDENWCDKNLPGIDLYVWATVSSQRSSLEHKFTMNMADGTVYEAARTGTRPAFRPQTVHITRDGSVCAAVHPERGPFLHRSDRLFNLTIGPGMDPCLIVSFVACMDKIETLKQGGSAGAYVAAC